MNADLNMTGTVVMKMLDSLQFGPPGAQVAGAAMMMLELSRHYGISPQVAFEAANNMFWEQKGTLIRKQFRVIRAYVENQL
jgi:hypothetical protein